MNKHIVLVLIIATMVVAYRSSLHANTYDTTSGPDLDKAITVTWKNIFHTDEYAKGFVKFPYGFIVRGQSIHIDVTEPIDGDIFFDNVSLGYDPSLDIDYKLILGKGATLSGQGSMGAGIFLGFEHPSPYNIVLTDDLHITGTIQTLYTSILKGNGNHIYVDKNAIWTTWVFMGIQSWMTIEDTTLHDVSSKNFWPWGARITLRDTTFLVEDRLELITEDLWFENKNVISGKPGAEFKIAVNSHIDRNSSLMIDEGIIWDVSAFGLGMYSTTTFCFVDKTSKLILNNCTLRLGSSQDGHTDFLFGAYGNPHEYLQKTYTFSNGTVVVNGLVSAYSPRYGIVYVPSGSIVLDGFALELGAQGVGGSLDLVFNPNARLRCGDHLVVNVRA